jgi:hypothetical protein
MSLLIVIPSSLIFVKHQYDLHLHRSQVKREILNNLPEHELVYFEWSAEKWASLEWEHEFEFRFRDEKYDVVRRVDLENGLTGIWCWPDREEKELEEKLSKVIAGLPQGPPNQKQNALLIGFIKSFHLPAPAQLNEVRLVLTPKLFPQFDRKERAGVLNQESPPPENYCSIST